MAYQTRDVIDAMVAVAGLSIPLVRVDGGGAVNNFVLQFQSDMLQLPIQRPHVVQTTALGAAYLAGLAVGYWDDQQQLATNWRLDREYTPSMPAAQCDERYRGWQEAVRRARGWTVAR
jgi:glycerol kinase